MTDRYESTSTEKVTVIGQTGATGEQGPKGESSHQEMRDLAVAVEKLAAAMTVLAEANANLSDRFQANTTATTRRIRTAVGLNILSTVLALLILPFLLVTYNAVNTVHKTQTTNSGIVKSLANTTAADANILRIINSVTNPAAEKASNARIVALLDHVELCIENHGDRARDILAHVKPPPKLAGCVSFP